VRARAHGTRQLRLRRICARLAQDPVRLTQLAHLPLQRLDAVPFLARRTGPLPSITLGLPKPAAQRLRRAADLRRDRADRRPFRGVLTLVLTHQAHRPLSNLRRKSPLSRVCHRHSLSKVEASDKPGAVHTPPVRFDGGNSTYNMRRLVSIEGRAAPA
jgi:hypothetical protein